LRRSGSRACCSKIVQILAVQDMGGSDFDPAMKLDDA
jgi:hypothetical protein